MLVRIYKVHVDPKYRAEIEHIEDEVCQFYIPENGCRFTQFFGDPETGWYGNISVWESMDHIKALQAQPELGPITERAKPLLLEVPITEIFPVYEPRPRD